MQLWSAMIAALLAVASTSSDAKTAKLSFVGDLIGDISRPGDHITGTITYDLGAIPDETFAGDGYNVGYYNSIATITGKIGGQSFSTDALTIVGDTYAGDDPDGVTFLGFYDGITRSFFSFVAPSASTLSGLAVPNSLAGYVGTLHLENNRDQSANAVLKIQAPVPEPSEWLLIFFGLGLIGLVLHVRKFGITPVSCGRSRPTFMRKQLVCRACGAC